MNDAKPWTKSEKYSWNVHCVSIHFLVHTNNWVWSVSKTINKIMSILRKILFEYLICYLLSTEFYFWVNIFGNSGTVFIEWKLVDSTYFAVLFDGMCTVTVIFIFWLIKSYTPFIAFIHLHSLGHWESQVLYIFHCVNFNVMTCLP